MNNIASFSIFNSLLKRPIFRLLSTKLYTRTHEWVDNDKIDKIAIIGITDYASSKIGDIIYVDITDEGTVIPEGKEISSVESVKLVSDIVSPIDCEVMEKNKVVIDNPEILSNDPEGEGWLIRAKITNTIDKNNFMSKDEYSIFIQKENTD